MENNDSVVSVMEAIHPDEYQWQHLVHGIRTDGRQFQELRQPLSITPTALSSCVRAFIVRWGKALLMGGIRAEVALSNPNYPQGGAIGTKFVIYLY